MVSCIWISLSPPQREHGHSQVACEIPVHRVYSTDQFLSLEVSSQKGIRLVFLSTQSPLWDHGPRPSHQYSIPEEIQKVVQEQSQPHLNPSFWKPGSTVTCLQCSGTALVFCDVSKRLLTMVPQSHLQIILRS